jgi:uncharacterized membrane protein YkvA (DUF1232 family)
MARMIKEMIILGTAIMAFIYLMLPSVLPDFIPIVGWIDEGAATLVLLNTLKYYGLDLTDLYGKPSTTRRIIRRKRPAQPGKVDGESDLIEMP